MGPKVILGNDDSLTTATHAGYSRRQLVPELPDTPKRGVKRELHFANGF